MLAALKKAPLSAPVQGLLRAAAGRLAAAAPRVSAAGVPSLSMATLAAAPRATKAAAFASSMPVATVVAVPQAAMSLSAGARPLTAATPRAGKAAPSVLSAPFRFETTVVAAAEAEPAAAEAVIVNAPAAEGAGFVSKALRKVASASYTNLPYSPRKLGLLCRLLRGLSVREALAQLRITEKKDTFVLRRALKSLALSARQNFNMHKGRLVVKELYCTKAKTHKRFVARARGRVGVRHLRYAHLFLKLEEQPYHPHEIRIGRFGRTIAENARVGALVKAWNQRGAQA